MLKSMRRLLVFVCVAALAAGCVTFPSPMTSELNAAAPSEIHAFRARTTSAALPVSRPPRPKSFDTTGLPLASGQLVLRDDGDALGFFMNLFAEDFHPWTHVGVLSIEGGKPYVYDTVMVLPLVTVPGQSPTITSTGVVRRMSLEEFTENRKAIAIYEPLTGAFSAPNATPVREHIVSYARRQFSLRTPFDPYFDNDDAIRQYCSEIVARAMGELGIVAPLAPVRANRSYSAVRDWMRIRTAHVYLPGLLVNSQRQIVLWSATLTRTQIDALFEVRRELARRFDSRARFGQVFRWTLTGLVFSDDVQRFIDDTEAAFANFTGDLAAVRAEVRRRADAYFQPVN